MSKQLLWTVTLLCLSGCKHTPKAAPPVSPKVNVMKAQPSTVPIYIETYGHIEAFYTVNIEPQVSGVLVGTYYKDGRPVKKGDLLISLYDKDYQAVVDQAKGTLESSIAKYHYYKKEKKRNEPLLAKNFISKDTFDQIVMNLEEAQGEVTQNKAALEKAQIDLGFTKIYAPYDGIMGNTFIDPGNFIPAASSSPIVSINKVDPISANFYFSEKYLHLLKEKLNQDVVYVNPEQKNKKTEWIKGKLNFIDNNVNEETGQLLVKGLYPNPDNNLWPGQYISVRIEVDKIKGYVLPSHAIQTGTKGPFVYIVEKNHTVTARPVTIATTDKDKRVVSKGIKEDDLVVIKGQLNLYPGAKVQVIRG